MSREDVRRLCGGHESKTSGAKKPVLFSIVYGPAKQLAEKLRFLKGTSFSSYPSVCKQVRLEPLRDDFFYVQRVFPQAVEPCPDTIRELFGSL
jgi:hypothetical protein